MSKKNRERGEKRRAEQDARRAAIAQQYQVPMSALAPSTPNKLGRALFLSKKDADRYFNTMKHVDPRIKQEDPSTWNPKREDPK